MHLPRNGGFEVPKSPLPHPAQERSEAMNSDLKRRLLEIQNACCQSGFVTDAPEKAAAEIERLEGEIKEWERVEVGKRHELKKLRDERNKLQDALDVARDEFQRIIRLNPGPEITGLCLRGKLGVERAVPLIQSYIKLESENQRLHDELNKHTINKPLNNHA